MPHIRWIADVRRRPQPSPPSPAVTGVTVFLVMQMSPAVAHLSPPMHPHASQVRPRMRTGHGAVDGCLIDGMHSHRLKSLTLPSKK